MTSLRLSNAEPSGLKADALVIGVSPGSPGRVEVPRSVEITPPVRRRITQALARLGAKATAGAVTKLPGVDAVAAPLVVAVGLGEPDEAGRWTPEALRRAAGAALREIAGVRTVAIALPGQSAAELAAVAQGALLGAYAFTRCRGAGGEPPASATRSISVLAPTARDRVVRDAVRQARIVATEVLLCRDLVNTPPSALLPKDLAKSAAASVAELPVAVRIFDEKALARAGYGGIVAVGQGSANPPRLVRLAYEPARSRARLVLIGKGITFDSGGLSIKTTKGMETMKSDMAGAAAVIAATVAIARLALPVTVIAYAACAENMPSATAQRPGDVITMLGGKTVEVINTDAEGRLVLADVLVRSGEDSPDFVVDVATLTGAQIVALGDRVGAVMANDDALRAAVVSAATAAGEQFWPMPLPAELRPSLDSPVADLVNTGERAGGMLRAGIFLREFVPDNVRWAHLDIAGPAFNEREPHDYTPKGGTGFAVRTLVQFARDIAEGAVA